MQQEGLRKTSLSKGVEPMKITDIELIPLNIPISFKRYLGVGALSVIENIILKIHTDEGITGIGEVSPWEVFAENSKSSLVILRDYLTPAVLGENPFNIEKILHKMNKALVGASFAKAGVEIALYDIIGKALNVPLYDILGGKFQEGVMLSYSVSSQKIELEVEEISALIEKGVKIFKVKTGILDHRIDVERIDEIRKLVDGKGELRIDYNQSIKPENGIKYCRELEQFDPVFIEQPLPSWDIEGMAKIARAIDTPIMADESVFSFQDAMRVVRNEAADIISIKLMKAGGIRNGAKIAAIAEAANVPCYSGLMWESSVGMSAALHLAVSTRIISYGGDYYIPYFLMENDIVMEPPKLEGGMVKPNSLPGLGIELDEKIVEKYRI